jgi:hypothetical protein
MFYKTILLQGKYKTKIDYSRPIETLFTNYLERLDALQDPVLDIDIALDQIRNHLLVERTAQGPHKYPDLAYGEDYQNDVLGLFIDFDASLREHAQDPAFLYKTEIIIFASGMNETSYRNSYYYQFYVNLFDIFNALLKQGKQVEQYLLEKDFKENLRQLETIIVQLPPGCASEKVLTELNAFANKII